jgi:hypothetical protein
MTATAERIEKEFATLTREEQEQVFDSLYRKFLAHADNDWPMSSQEKEAMFGAVREAEQEIKAGKGISNEEMKRRVAEWLKRTTQ